MTQAKLQRLLYDYSNFAENSGIGKIGIVIVYLDNFLFFGFNLKEIKKVKKNFTNQ